MFDTRQTLTAFLQSSTRVTNLLADGPVSVYQEDTELTKVAFPCIVLAFDGAEPFRDHTLFVMERWNIWLITPGADYYTLGKLAKVVRQTLDQSSLDPLPNEENASAGLSIEWIYDGPAVADKDLDLHTQVQRYWVLRQE